MGKRHSREWKVNFKEYGMERQKAMVSLRGEAAASLSDVRKCENVGEYMKMWD